MELSNEKSAPKKGEKRKYLKPLIWFYIIVLLNTSISLKSVNGQGVNFPFRLCFPRAMLTQDPNWSDYILTKSFRLKMYTHSIFSKVPFNPNVKYRKLVFGGFPCLTTLHGEIDAMKSWYRLPRQTSRLRCMLLPNTFCRQADLVFWCTMAQREPALTPAERPAGSYHTKNAEECDTTKCAVQRNCSAEKLSMPSCLDLFCDNQSKCKDLSFHSSR